MTAWVLHESPSQSPWTFTQNFHIRNCYLTDIRNMWKWHIWSSYYLGLIYPFRKKFDCCLKSAFPLIFMLTAAEALTASWTGKPEIAGNCNSSVAKLILLLNWTSCPYSENTQTNKCQNFTLHSKVTIQAFFPDTTLHCICLSWFGK